MNHHSFDSRAFPPSPREMYSASHYETIPAANGIREETFALKRAPPAVPVRSPDTRLSTFASGRTPPVAYDTGIYNEPDVFEEPSSPLRQGGHAHFTPTGSPKLPPRQEHHRPSLPGTGSGSRPFCYGIPSSSDLQRKNSGSDCSSNGPRTPPHSQTYTPHPQGFPPQTQNFPAQSQNYSPQTQSYSAQSQSYSSHPQNYSPQWQGQGDTGLYTQMTDSITELPPYPYEEEPTYQTIQKVPPQSRAPAVPVAPPVVPMVPAVPTAAAPVNQRVASPVAARKHSLQGETNPSYSSYPGSPVYPGTPPHSAQQHHRPGVGVDPNASSPKHRQQWEGGVHPGYGHPSSPHATSAHQSPSFPSPTHSTSGYPSSAHQGHGYPSSAHSGGAYPSNSHGYPSNTRASGGYPASGSPTQGYPSPTHGGSNAYPASTHPTYVYPSGSQAGHTQANSGQHEHYMAMSPRAQTKFPKGSPHPADSSSYNMGYNPGYKHGVLPPPSFPAPPPPLAGPGGHPHDRSPSPPLPPPPPELGRNGPPPPPLAPAVPQSMVEGPPPLPPISTIPNLKGDRRQQEVDIRGQSPSPGMHRQQSQPMGDVMSSDVAAELIKMRLKRAHQPETTKATIPKTSSAPESELSTIQLRTTGKLKEVCSQENTQEASRLSGREENHDFPPPPPPPSDLAVQSAPPAPPVPQPPPPQPNGSNHASHSQPARKTSKEKQGPIISMDLVIPEGVDISKCPGLVEIPYNCPNWKREMLDKKNREKIEEYIQMCMKEKEEAEKWKNVPAWKRDILKKKSHEPAEQQQQQHKVEEPAVKKSPPDVPPKEAYNRNPNIVPAALSIDPEELESMPPWKRELLFKREKVPITFSNEFNPDGEEEDGQVQQS